MVLMRVILRLLPALLLVLPTGAACDSPVAPSTSFAPPNQASGGGSAGLPGSPGLPGQPIAIGQTVEAEIQASSYPMCEFGNDPYPCGRYLLDVPRSGRVAVQMDFVGAHLPMFIAFETPTFHASRGNFVAIGGSPLAGSFQASAGHLTLAVGVDAPYGVSAVYRYRFVTTLE